MVNQPRSRTRTLTDYLQQTFTTHPQIIKDAILPRRGRLILGANKGVGKTLLFDQLACEIASGEPALGLYDIPEPMRVLLIQKEVADEAFQIRMDQTCSRYIRLNRDKIGVLSMEEAQDIKLDTADGRRILVEEIKAFLPNVLMLDPISWFHSVDEDKSVYVKPLLEFINGLITQFGLSIVISHHFKKPSVDPRSHKPIHQGMADFRGSGLWTEWADTVMWMNDLGHDKVMLEMFCRHGREEAQTLVMTRNRKYACFDAVVQDLDTSAIEMKVIGWINQHNMAEIGYDDLFEYMIKHCKVGERSARNHISIMRRKNLIYFKGQNGDRIVRALTPSARSWLR